MKGMKIGLFWRVTKLRNASPVVWYIPFTQNFQDVLKMPLNPNHPSIHFAK